MMERDNIVLAYHSIGMPVDTMAGAKSYCVSRENFRRQMEYLHKGTVPFGDSPLSSPILTFDDGDITNYTNAFPILKELGLKAYFFIIGAKVETPGYMNWGQLKELHKAGMTIGSHGMTHRILLGLKDSEIECELKESKKLLEDKLNCSIDSFSVPRGFHNAKILDKAKEAGYKIIFTYNNRITVRADWTTEHLIKVLRNGYTLREKIVELAKSSSQKLVGIKNYDRIRTMLLR